MELTFNPEEEFERIIGRPLIQYEKKELNEFLADYLLRNKRTNDLGITIESALESDNQNEFTKKDFEITLQEYRDTHKIIPKELISSVREVCDFYHSNQDNSKIKKVLDRQNFRELKSKYGISLEDVYVRKRSSKYTFLLADEEDETKFISVPPSKGKKLEKLLLGCTNVGFPLIGGFWAGAVIGVAYAVSTGDIAGGIGIGFGTYVLSGTAGVVIYSAIKKKKAKKAIKECFSKFPSLCGKESYNPEIILNAFAE